MEKKNTNIKIILGFVAVIATIFWAHSMLRQPPSIEYLKQHPEEFRFEDYRNETNLQKTLQELFPIGTTRTDVENIVMDQAGFASSYTEGRDRTYYVTYYLQNQNMPSYFDFLIWNNAMRQMNVEYDINDNVKNIKAHILHGKTSPKFFTGISIKKGEKP